MMMKFMVYLDAGDGASDVYKVAVPATDITDAKKWVAGNGEIIAVKNVTDDYKITEDRVAEALIRDGFSQIETDFICRALRRIGIAE